jgi:hypothetical protein
MGAYLGYRDGSGSTNEQGLHQDLNKLFTKGVSSVHSATSGQVTQRGAGANMSVDVAIGDFHLPRPAGDYSYWGWTDAASNVVITAANAANPRIDVVVAYVDLTITTGLNNPGALKFTAIAGTPAGSPTVPSDSTIQSTLGANVPFIKLGQVTVPANAASIVNANITDIRQAIGLKGRLWGGSSNTFGHTVPNAADDTVLLANAAQTISGKTIGSTQLSNPYKFRVYLGANTTMGGGTVIVGFDTRIFDTSSNLDITGNKGRFTAPISGFYQFNAAVNSNLVSGNVGFIALHKNGNEYSRGSEVLIGNTFPFASTVSDIIQLAAGDYIDVRATGSAGQTLYGTSAATYFSGFLVSAS